MPWWVTNFSDLSSLQLSSLIINQNLFLNKTWIASMLQIDTVNVTGLLMLQDIAEKLFHFQTIWNTKKSKSVFSPELGWKIRVLFVIFLHLFAYSDCYQKTSSSWKRPIFHSAISRDHSFQVRHYLIVCIHRFSWNQWFWAIVLDRLSLDDRWQQQSGLDWAQCCNENNNGVLAVRFNICPASRTLHLRISFNWRSE